MPLFCLPFTNLSLSYSNPLWICSWTALTAVGSYSIILTTLHEPITFLLKSLMNLLLDSLSNEWAHIPLFWPPFTNLSFSYSNPLWICFRTALTAVGSYSIILTTLPEPIAFLFKSFMNLLLDGFSGHEPIFHYSDTLHKPIIFAFKSFMILLLAGFSSHGLIFHYSDHPS